MRRARVWMLILVLCAFVLPLVTIPAATPAALAAQQRPTPTPPPCTVTVKGPKQVSVGNSIPFYAEVTHSGNANLTFTWSVNPKSIGFQDYGDQITTNSVNQPGQVTANVRLSGGPCEGKSDTSDPVEVTGGAAVNLIGQCKGREPLEKCQQVQDQFVAGLLKDPNTKGRIVYHEQVAQPIVGQPRAEHVANTLLSAEMPVEMIRLRISFESQQPARPENLTPVPASPAESQKGPALKLAESVRDFLLRSGIPTTRIILEEGIPWPEYGVELFILRPGPVVGGPVAPVPPGPVEVSWEVLPQTVVGDNFGGRVRKNFYAVNVVIANRSGYDLQVDAIGFTPSSPATPSQPITPTVGHKLIRGTILRDQHVGLRGRVLGTIRATGGLLTGAAAFVRNDRPRANFGQIVNIISNPLEMGFEMLFPDETIEHLGRLEDNAFRAGAGGGLIMAKDESTQTIVFVPKESLGLGKGERADLGAVRKKLGTLIVMGRPIQRLSPIAIPAGP
jgi:hypothetical protein